MRKSRTVLMLDEDMNIIAGYKNCKEASENTGITKATIYGQCAHNYKSKEKYRFVFEEKYTNEITRSKQSVNLKDYVVEEEPKEIAKREKQEMLINVLVSMVNGTLEDKTKVILQNTEYVYSKKDEALLLNGSISPMFTRKMLISESTLELPILENESIMFLRNLLKAYKGFSIKGIRKCVSPLEKKEFIRIEMKDSYDNVILPVFEEGKYYSAMERERLYTLEELDI